MKLVDALMVLQHVDGKDKRWMHQWGSGTIREAIRTVNDRASATGQQKQKAERISLKLNS